MSTILLGVENSTGNMTKKETGELIEWDNLLLHVMSNDREEVKGWFCTNMKCKTKNIAVIGAEKIEDLLYKPVYLQLDVTAKKGKDYEPTVSAVIAAPFTGSEQLPVFPMKDAAKPGAGAGVQK